MIRKATLEDLPCLMEIFHEARGIMRRCGKDIEEGNCVVLCVDDECGTILLANGDPREAYQKDL